MQKFSLKKYKYWLIGAGVLAMTTPVVAVSAVACSAENKRTSPVTQVNDLAKMVSTFKLNQTNETPVPTSNYTETSMLKILNEAFKKDQSKLNFKFDSSLLSITNWKVDSAKETISFNIVYNKQTSQTITITGFKASTTSSGSDLDAIIENIPHTLSIPESVLGLQGLTETELSKKLDEIFASIKSLSFDSSLFKIINYNFDKKTLMVSFNVEYKGQISPKISVLIVKSSPNEIIANTIVSKLLALNLSYPNASNIEASSLNAPAIKTWLLKIISDQDYAKWFPGQTVDLSKINVANLGDKISINGTGAITFNVIYDGSESYIPFIMKGFKMTKESTNLIILSYKQVDLGTPDQVYEIIKSPTKWVQFVNKISAKIGGTMGDDAKILFSSKSSIPAKGTIISLTIQNTKTKVIYGVSIMPEEIGSHFFE